MILEFGTLTEANACLAAVNQYILDRVAAEGYTVQDGAVIGKCAATGQDMPGKTKTTGWDTVKQSPDETYYFTSLTGTRFAGAMDEIAEFDFTEKEWPESWDD